MSGVQGRRPSSLASSGKRVESPAAAKASRAAQPAAWCWPWPSRGSPLKVDTMIWGRNRRTIRTTSFRMVSLGQCSQVSSSDLE